MGIRGSCSIGGLFSPAEIIEVAHGLGAAPICNYLNPSMENENLVCGAPMLIIDVAIYSFLIYALLWLTGKIKIREKRVSTEDEI